MRTSALYPGLVRPQHAHRPGTNPPQGLQQFMPLAQDTVRFAGISPMAPRTYQSKLPPAEVIKRIDEQMDRLALTFWSTQHGRTLRKGLKNNKGFVGEIEGDTFRLMKKRWYNHGSAPVLEGKVLPTANGGSTISTRITRLPSANVVRGIVYGISGVTGIASLGALATQAAQGALAAGPAIGLLTPLLLPVVFLAVETPLTRYEAKAMQELMDKLFKPTT